MQENLQDLNFLVKENQHKFASVIPLVLHHIVFFSLMTIITFDLIIIFIKFNS